MSMLTTREQVMTALFAKLTASGAYKTAGRRNRAPDAFTPATTPALMLVEHSESYKAPVTHQPPVRRLMVKAILYSDVGDDLNAIPAAPINALLDGLDAALAPDNPATGQCTLGAIVTSVAIDGAIVKAPGEKTGKSLAVVPLTILLP